MRSMYARSEFFFFFLFVFFLLLIMSVCARLLSRPNLLYAFELRKKVVALSQQVARARVVWQTRNKCAHASRMVDIT